MSRKRTNRIRVWLSDKELEKLNRAVKSSGLNRESYIHTLINGFIPIDKPQPDFFKMMRELHAIGNNMNQIAHRAHVTGSIEAERYEQCACELAKTTSTIVQAAFEHRKLEFADDSP
jgi:peptide subunit release factor 1 (eRF1)